METIELLIQIKDEILDLKKLLVQIGSNPFVSENWLTRTQVKEFLKYGDIQMAALEKTGVLNVSRIGKRKFIHRNSLEKLLDKGKP